MESCLNDVFWFAEKYLIQLCKYGIKSDIFSELSSILKPPPSSRFTTGHVRRYRCAVRMSLDFLRGDNEMMNLLMFSWKETHSTFSAKKCYMPLPDKYVVNCGCKIGKWKGRCNCRKMDASCTKHCRYKGKCDDYICKETTKILQ